MSNPQQVMQPEQNTPSATPETISNNQAATAWQAYTESKLLPIDIKQARRERLLALFQQSATHP